MEYEKNLTLKEKSHAELSVKIKKADVQESYKNLVNKYSKELQIPGFRKGHIPAKILETKYGEAIRGDLAGNLIEDSLKEIFETMNEYERPLPYSYPEMTEKAELKPEEDFSFTVHYDVFPKVEIKKAEGFKIEVPEVEPSDADVKKELERLQDRNALVADCKEGASAEKNNIVTVNYCELDESGNTIAGSERQDFVFTLGTGQNFFKIDDDVIGMKKGDTKEITKTYPENEENKELAGKTKKIKVTLTALKYKDLPAIDDDLAQDINEKYKTLEELKADIKKNIQNGIDEKIKKLKEKTFTERLVEENPVELPESMLKAELESRWIMMANQFRTTPENLEKIVSSMNGQSKADFLELWKPEAEKSLKGRVLIETLLKEKNIEVSDEEMEAEYKRLSELTGMSVDEVKKHYADERQKEYFIDELKEDKLFNALYEKCTISKGKKLSVEKFFETNQA
ncbi:trigger factor [Treponema pedis]|uniref:Trigger factor n=1 Tax=Treponema pedis TaxID=409322 RepID=A0A7S7AX07_9SPIR|nr:trigger factor [Treponema pedis]QOW61116.1 trigger factor [Treponema pedis]